MAEVSFDVCEWRIENFSCWNKEVHGDWIHSPEPVLEYVQRMRLCPRYGQDKQITVYFLPSKPVPSCSNLSFIGSDGSLLCTKRMQGKSDRYGTVEYCLYSGLKFEEVAAKVKNKGDQLILRLCFLSDKKHAVAVSTTLDVLNLSLKIDPKSVESMESNDTKNISIIRYSKKNVLDELLLKAARKEETVEFILELMTKTVAAISVESQWSIQSIDKTIVRNEEKKFYFRHCEPWKFSTSSMGELVEKDITMHLRLKIISGDTIHKVLNAPSELTTVPKKTVFFFDQDCFMGKDSVSSKETGDSVTALLNDFMCLYQDQKFSDLQLKCDSVTFPVHRVILSARSPVFDRLLSSNMREASSGTVDIGDLDPSTLGLFLTYLYTGTVEEGLQYDSALNLYYAADKYQVPSLKGECAKFLCDNVSLSNVCDLLSLTNRHQDDELTSAAQDFVLNHYNQVLTSNEWGNLVKREPSLVAETVTSIAAKSSFGKN